MLAEIVPPIATPFLSFVALFIALITWSKNQRATRYVQHYSFVTQAEKMLSANIACLRFHGIDPDTIEKLHGVTSTDLSYLLQLFNSGSISNILSNKGRKKPFEKGSYWYDILKNEPTQDAFPLLQQLFDSNNYFMARCEITIDSINRMGGNNAHNKST